MKTVAEYLEKAEALEQLARAAGDELLRATYQDLAKSYRDLAKDRRELLDSVVAVSVAKPITKR